MIEQMYKKIRETKGDCKKIADNTRFAPDLVWLIKKHLFFWKYEDPDAFPGYKPDMETAKAWLRLSGKRECILPKDILLLKQAANEIRMITGDYSYEEAHEQTMERFQKEIASLNTVAFQLKDCPYKQYVKDVLVYMDFEYEETWNNSLRVFAEFDSSITEHSGYEKDMETLRWLFGSMHGELRLVLFFYEIGDKWRTDPYADFSMVKDTGISIWK